MAKEKLDLSQQCALAVQKSNHILGCLRRSMATIPRKVILPFYSALLRPHPEYHTQVWGPQHRKDMDLFKRVQRRATRAERPLLQRQAERVGVVQPAEGSRETLLWPFSI